MAASAERMATSWCAWLAVGLLAGCGDNLHPVEAADVSILYPLPDTLDQLVLPSEQGAYGTLFPEALFPTAIGPVDVGITYADMRLIALRLDPCSARKDCNSEVRAIFQPVVEADGGPTVADGAIHVFYGLPRAELVTFLDEILALKEQDGAGIAYGSELGPQPILAATGLDGAFARGLHALVLEHLGESRIERFTERNHQIPLQDRWDFYLFDGTGLARQTIATTTTDEQQVTGTPADPQSAGGVVLVNPVLDSPLIPIVDVNRPAGVTDEIRAGYARALELQDPTKETSESVDCVSCHLAEGARHIGETQYGLAPEDAFASPRSLAYRRDLRAVTDLHIFAYDGRSVSVAQRVANESAVIADAMQLLLK
jgi:hypothetical protein